jgi:hypothetical protein
MNLRAICIPSSVKRLCEECFSHCEFLSKVAFEPGSVLCCIENKAFFNCPVLSSIHIPANLERFCPFALRGPKLRDISVADGNRHFKVSGHFLLDFECLRLDRYFGNVPEVLIPNTVNQLNIGCFRACGTVLTVGFESGSRVSCIKEEAFSMCESLQSICFPSCLESIGHHCLFECTSLSTVTFEPGSKLSYIGPCAFQGCAALSSICVPSGVERIYRDCFSACKRLSAVTFESGSKLSWIEQQAFANCDSLVEISIPCLVERVCGRSFADCRSLAMVTFETGSRVAAIEVGAFFGCRPILSIYIPSAVQRLRDSMGLLGFKVIHTT